jgi:hypothetical protein
VAPALRQRPLHALQPRRLARRPRELLSIRLQGRAGIGLDLATRGDALPALVGDEPIADVAHTCPKHRALAEQVPGG